MRIRLTVAVAATTCGLLAPATAGAATKTVSAGTPAAAQKSFRPTLSDVNAFFPSTVTVAAGDSVRFLPAGFHTIHFPAKGKGPAPLFAPTGIVSGAVDAAGAPFWFNGQPSLAFNPALLTSGFGKRLSYTGAKDVQSGLPLGNKPKPMTVRFPKAGTYTYYCDVHPGMKATVRVRPTAAGVPSVQNDRKRVKKQTADALKTAKALAATKPGPSVVRIGAAGKGGVERFAFFPAAATVPVGTTVRFEMAPGSREVHTATFGPGNPETEPNSFLGQMTKSLESPAPNPAALYPSDLPGTVANLTPTTHGNGFWNTGALDASAATPIPAANSVRFAQAGTYQVYCLIHPFMHGTITVQ